MNRNLKRVLALALTMVVMAVNFMIPAMAAASITVSYTDLLSYGSLQQRQGEIYYETSAGNANANSGLDSSVNKNKAYAPLEVWSATTNAGLNILAKEWVRFEAEVSTAGYYSVDMNAAVGAANGTYVYIRTEKSIIEKELAKTGNQYGYKDITDLGYVYLEEGLNHIYVDNKGGSYINFRSLTLTLDEEADATLINWLAPVQSANEIADYTVAYTDGYNQAEVNTATFHMDIPLDGKYKVSVMGMTSWEHDVSVDFGGDIKTATVNNYDYAYTDLGVFALTADSYTMTLDNFSGYSLAWAKLEYVGPYGTDVENESFSDGDIVARGTDNLIITFNDIMVDGATATLIADGVEVPVAVDVAGANVIISFLETLAYETEYTLEVTGLQGINDEAPLADRTYNFTTGDDSSDEGVDDVEITDVDSCREDATIKGIVKGSTDYGIKGRTVAVINSEGDEVATGISGDNGEFTADFIIAESESGVYPYTVVTEYGTTESVSLTYVSKAEELRILGLFNDATTPDAVDAIFEAYGDILGIFTFTEDCESLTDDDLFLVHFAGKDFSAVSEVAPFYNKMLLLEQLNQATRGSYVYSNFFSKPEVLSLLFEEEVVAKMMALSMDEKHEIADDYAMIVANEGFCTSVAEVAERILSLLNSYLGSGDAELACADWYNDIPVISGGQAIIIPLILEEARSQVSEVTFTITADNPSVFTEMAYTNTGYSYDEYGYLYWYNGYYDEDGNHIEGKPVKERLSVKGKTASITLTYDSPVSGADFGALVLESTIAKNYSLTISGTAKQKFYDTYVENFSVLPKQVGIDTTCADGYYNDGYCEIVWQVDADGLLTIRGGGSLGSINESNDYNGYRINAPYDKYRSYIKKVVIEDGIYEIGYNAFGGYFALEEVVLPETVESIGAQVFYNCHNLKTINIPDTLNYIGGLCFWGCSSLTEIYIPETVYQIRDYTFYDCRNLQELIIPDNVRRIGAYALEGCVGLRKVTLGRGLYEIDTSAGGLFEGCHNLESVTIKSALDSIHKAMFYNCSNLKEIVFPDSVTLIDDYAFVNCSSLEKIVIPETVTSIGYAAFSGCSALKSVSIPEGITEIDSYTFMNCDSLETLYIPEGVTKIQSYAFEGCDSLKTISLPDSVTEIGVGAFVGCPSIQKLTLPDGLVALYNGAFALCTGLQEINWSENLTILANCSFQDCDSLVHLDFPEQLEVIGVNTFMDCDNLKSISLTPGTTLISDGAFYGCDALTDVYFGGTEEEWNAIYIGDGNEALLSATIHFVTRLTYDANGGENAPETVNENGEVVISDTVPTRFGYIFKGWSVDKIASIAQYQPGDTINLTEGSIVLHAVWSPIEAGARIYDDELMVSIYNAPIGSQLVVACYNGTKLVHIDGATVTSETRYYFGVGGVTYDNIKVMLYEDFINMSPLMNPVEVPLF